MDGSKNALNAIDTDMSTHYLTHVESLEHRIDAARAAVEKSFADLEATATTTTTNYIEALHRLTEALTTANHGVETSVAATEKALIDAKGHIDDLNRKREGDLHDLAAAMVMLEASYTKLEHDAATGVNAVGEQAADLSRHVNAGTQSIHGHGETLTHGLTQTQTGFAGELTAMAQTLHDFAQSVETDHHQHDGEHEAATSQTHDHAATGIAANVATLQDGMGVVHHALEVLDTYSGQFGGHFGDGAKGLMSTIEEIAHIVESIKPVLDVVKAIE